MYRKPCASLNRHHCRRLAPLPDIRAFERVRQGVLTGGTHRFAIGRSGRFPEIILYFNMSPGVRKSPEPCGAEETTEVR